MNTPTVDPARVIGYMAARTEGVDLIAWDGKVHPDWLPARLAVWEAQQSARAQGLDPRVWDVVVLSSITPAQVRAMRDATRNGGQ
ncbi:hypothetical protein [Nocardia sp. NPDC004711]